MAGQSEKTALDLIEEACYLVRNASAGTLAAYYIGTLPFTLAFLFFWSDMGGSATAYDHCAPAALGVAIMYIWMSAWQGVFAQRLRSTLTGTPPGLFRRVAFVQASLQPTKLVVIPIAALIVVPLGSVFAFFQNLMAISYSEARGIRRPFAVARRQGKLWGKQNWVVLGFISMLSVVVFLNLAVLLLMGPQLLKSFFGIDTPLTRSMSLMFNSTFLAITATLTYAIVDPLIKAIYVLRCFYGESLATGEDLKAQLKAIAAQVTAAKTAMTIAFVGGMFLCAQPVHAQQPQPAGAPRNATAAPGPAVQDLNRSIDEVLKHPRFSWRLPGRAEPAQKKSWLMRQFDSFRETIARWVDGFLEWLRDRFRSKQPAEEGKRGLPALRVWFYVLLGAAILIFIFLFAGGLRKKSRAPAGAQAVTMAVPDLASDHTSADQMPADEWLRTARECVARNNLRLAVRALYLANLAYLGGRSLIALDRAKSNHDYTRELGRRGRSKPEILPVFGDTIGVFERVWYGMHEPNADVVARIEANLAATRARVEQ